MSNKARSKGCTNDWIYTLVLDMNNIMKISAVNHTANEEGKECGMVTNALRIIGNILLKKDFDYCIAAYDGFMSGFLRWQIYNDYKANRDKHYEAYGDGTLYDKSMLLYSQKVMDYAKHKKGVESVGESEEDAFERQKLVLQNILEELCIRQYEFDSVEGDDIVSYYVHHKKQNEKVVIVSSDKDLTQLISETVVIYNPRTKHFITTENSVDELGIRYDNVVLEKIICGDSSDNIKGVKGMGEATLLKLFPEIKATRLDLSALVARSQALLTERLQQKKKPLKTLENIVGGITDGCQGDRLYEINQKIIDLSQPLLTKEAEKELEDVLYSPMDTTDRSVTNVYRIFEKNKMYTVMDEEKFGNLLSPYSRIIMMEQKRFKNFQKS